MQRISLLLATLLPSCATDVVSTATNQAASTAYLAESRRCDPSFCIIFTAQDSDHDGVADADEIAAGTDPHDPLKYPTLVTLAKLMAAHELPTFEIGNSMMMLLPTRDANGLPVFGGEASLPARKSGLETAGIKTPDGIDIARGFTMSRTAASHEISFGQLFTAFGREKEGAMPLRLFADAIGVSPNGAWSISDGKIEGKTPSGAYLGGAWSKSGFTVQGGGFVQSVAMSRDSEGNLTTVTQVARDLGGPFATRKETTVINTTSSDGRWSTTTTQTDTTQTNEKGTTTQRGNPRLDFCWDGSCTSVPEPSDPPKDVPPADEPEDTDPPPDDGGDHGDDEDATHGYIDPDATEQTGIITANLDGMRTAIAKLGSTILVVQNDNDPLSSYEIPPGGIHDAYGPIALYGGDPDSASFGITPAFVRVPQPEYDPRMTEQLPPMDAPPDGTCVYCYQH